MRKTILQTLPLITLIFCALALQAGSATVFAAASLTDSLQEIADDYMKTSADKVVFNFGSSGMLARQIHEGAPADIFFSADQAEMDSLEKQDLIVSGSRRNRLSNSLVIIVPSDSKLTIASAKDLTQSAIKRIALADPQTVPAGIYSRKYLEKLALWQTISPKIIPTANVRAALAAVESGNVEAGLVYKTDAAISTKVKVAFAVPPGDGPDIVYPMALVKGAKNADTARQFLDYLATPAAGRVFEKFGFLLAK